MTTSIYLGNALRDYALFTNTFSNHAATLYLSYSRQKKRNTFASKASSTIIKVDPFVKPYAI